MSAVYWIDIEDGTGVKLGSGPIITATSWTSTARLDRAGTFTFTMPATDDRAGLLRAKRIARCWTIDNGILQVVGAGIIDNIVATEGGDGLPMLTVSGDDLLRQLTYRTVGDLALMDTITEHPGYVFATNWDDRSHFDDELHFSSWPYIYDFLVGDTSTYESVSFNGTIVGGANRTVIVYIMHPIAFDAVIFTITDGNSFDDQGVDAFTMTWEFWNAEDEEWQTLAVEDGTDTTDAGIAFYGSGTVSFDPPAGWGPAAGQVNYKIRFYSSAGAGDAVKFSDIAVRHVRPTTDALTPIMALAAQGWSYDTVNGYSEIGAATELGDNLVLNGSFEDFTGDKDNTVNDAFDNWILIVGGSEKVLAVTDGVSGTCAIKFTNDAGYTSSPTIYQSIAVSGSSDYLLKFWTKGDGTRELAYRIAISLDGGYSHQYTSAPEDTGITGTTWTEVTRRVTTPAGATNMLVMFLGPWYLYPGSAYVDNVSLRQRLGGEVLQEFAGDSVLSALVIVGEQTGEHFTQSPRGKEVLWLRKDRPSSGVRALGNIDGLAAAKNDKACIITSLTEIHNAYDLCSRIYPYGGGQGSDRVTLADCTRAVPDGYTMSKTENYLSRTAAQTALGRIEKVKTWSDINAPGSAASHRQYASNQLFDRAYSWLQTHSATNTDRASGPQMISYDSFTRSNGAIGSTEDAGPTREALAQYAWSGATWTISGGKAVNTPTLGSELVTNGTFATDTGWIKGSAEWTINGGVAVKATGAVAQSIYQSTAISAGNWYRMGWTIATYTAGTFYSRLSANFLPGRTAAGSYVNIGRTANTVMGIYGPIGSIGTIDNVSLKAITTSTAFATVNYATANVSVSVALSSWQYGTQAGVVARLDSATSPANFLILYRTDSTTIKLEECIAGSYTTLASYTSIHATGERLELQLRGATWSVIRTDAAGVEYVLGSGYCTNTTGTRHGMFSTYSGNTFDNWQCEQLDGDGYDVPRAYRLSVTKLNRIVLPGYSLRVQYRKQVGSYKVFDIDEEMTVLSSTTSVDSDGMRTVALEVSTVAEQLVTDAEYVAQELRNARYDRARTTGSQGLNDGSGGIAYAMGIRDGRVVNVARRKAVADGTYANVTVVNGVITSGS